MKKNKTIKSKKNRLLVAITLILLNSIGVHAISSSTRIISNSSPSVIIEHHSTQPTYAINGRIYNWHDLSVEQQKQLAMIHQKIKVTEAKLQQLEASLNPIMEKIEAEVEKIERISEAMESKLANEEDIPLSQLETVLEKQERIIRVHQQAINKHEKLLREHEEKARGLEEKFEINSKKIEKELDSHIQNIVRILEKKSPQTQS